LASVRRRLEARPTACPRILYLTARQTGNLARLAPNP
jgi:hypothetical protein